MLLTAFPGFYHTCLEASSGQNVCIHPECNMVPSGTQQVLNKSLLNVCVHKSMNKSRNDQGHLRCSNGFIYSSLLAILV